MKIQNTLTVDQIAHIRQSFLIEHSAEPVIDVSAVSLIDLAGIQFLIAVLKQFPRKEGRSRITGSLMPSFRQPLLQAGIIDNSCDTGEELEVQLESFLR